MKFLYRAALASVLLMGTAASALAQPLVGTEVAGVVYPGAADVGSSKLQLNGAGVRYKAVFKVYAAGLYLAAKAHTPQAVYSAPGAKRLHVVMLRDIDGKELGKLFTEGIKKNVSREEFAESIGGILKLADLFAARKRLVAGDAFTVDFTPASGTIVSINGKAATDAIAEPVFFTALMKIWLGTDPADWQLKDALLGQG